MKLSRILASTVIAVGLLGGVGHIAYADNNIAVDLSKIDPDVAKRIIVEQQRLAAESEKKPPAISPENAHEYIGMGKEVAEAISATAKGLSMEVNDFVKTPVGQWVLFILVWKLVFAPIMVVAFQIIGWLLLLLIFWRSMKKFFWSDNKCSDDGMVTATVCHIIAAIFLMVVFLSIVF